jgi:hypothetical protein
MKKTLFVLCLLSTTAAFGQYYSGLSTLNNQAQSPSFLSHPAHAEYAALAQETNILATTNYSSAQGERPASDFPQGPQASLGERARELRKEHENVKKSRVVWINQ